jgi:spoIIIJ-associated protein
MSESPTPLSEEITTRVRDYLQGVVTGMGLTGSVQERSDADGTLYLTVDGADAAELIGPNGRVINALQYLTVLVAQRHAGRHVRVVVDADGYRARREEALREMALEHARRVAESGQEAVFESLTSYERRIIHNTLIDHPDVTTYSEGQEPDRHIVISPREE